MMDKNQKEAGVTLIEILITLLVISFGMLGLGLMQARAVKSATDSFQRSQATWLASEMTDRMRANPNGLVNYQGASIGSGQTQITDPGSVTSITTRATKDLYEWQQNLTSAGGRAGLDKPVGTITAASGVYTVTIQWQGGSKSSGPESRSVRIITEF
jgi:type IV pilus assembly protein PilV